MVELRLVHGPMVSGGERATFQKVRARSFVRSSRRRDEWSRKKYMHELIIWFGLTGQAALVRAGAGKGFNRPPQWDAPASMDACISADAAPELLGPAARNLNLSPTRVQRS